MNSSVRVFVRVFSGGAGESACICVCLHSSSREYFMEKYCIKKKSAEVYFIIHTVLYSPGSKVTSSHRSCHGSLRASLGAAYLGEPISNR